MDLAQFVSDYWQMTVDNDTARPTAEEIADAWQEANGLSADPDPSLIASIRYYLP